MAKIEMGVREIMNLDNGGIFAEYNLDTMGNEQQNMVSVKKNRTD